MNEQANETEESPNAFLVALGQIRHGEAVSEASRIFAELLAAVRETQKKGKISLEVEARPMGDDQVMIKATTKPAIPQPDVPAAVFFFDDDNGIHSSDPRQEEFEFRRPKEREIRAAQ